MPHFLVVGGGAAGFFAAIRAKEVNPDLKVTIIEKSSNLLGKVKISGGGRCNVTHACFNPKDLVEFYPRGKKELLGPFHRFATGDTMEWFESRGVPLKIEDDGRVFPISDRSESIITCLINEAIKKDILIITNCGMEDISQTASGVWSVQTTKADFEADYLMIASGSSNKVWSILSSSLHLDIVEPVPSLFTFNIDDVLLRDLPGLSVPNATITISDHQKLEANGPVLITHWGLSGPAVLRLSAWGARWMAEHKYCFDVKLNWLGMSKEVAMDQLKITKADHPQKSVFATAFHPLPSRLWQRFLQMVDIDIQLQWANISSKQMSTLADWLTGSMLSANGKSTFKEEFVTAGGISLKEIDFKTFSSRRFPSLFFAGEILDIDAITGGFNFQAAWTGGYIAGEAVGTASC